ncbi:MAG TPA: L-histidine N(alpha)-methyltransferase [Acidimicrobiales bacterium]|nr:L-histidine N(alpha)-methyltransferase [Acidimicrobiales bacterium]
MTVPPRGEFSIEVHLSPDQLAKALQEEAAFGLTSSPKQLAPTWFYDERGCELFEQITTLPEYYPTRTERAIIEAHADEIASVSGATTLVELGSGTSAKTRLLLDAFARAGTLQRFVPFDVAEGTLRTAAATVATEYPGVKVHAVVGDFRQHLELLPRDGPRVVAFLGGTIGNFRPAERGELLATLTRTLSPGESFLVGTDLVKDRGRLVAAYDDAAGVTAEFNRNVLRVLNQSLGADFDVDAFEHVARFNEHEEWIEMWLRSRQRQQVRIRTLGLGVAFEEGEGMLTEVSAKFRPEGVNAELRAAGLSPLATWTDPGGDFALTLARR